MTYYLLRNGRTEEAEALFSSLCFIHPFLWFGIQTVEEISNKPVPTSFNIMGSSNSPRENAQNHWRYGSFEISEHQYGMIGSFDWAEKISEAQFETYHEIANLPILDLKLKE